MAKRICYNCGKEISKQNLTTEHIPAQNLYEGFGNEFKRNRITVDGCSKCNNLYSKIDQEIRDVLAVKNENPELKCELTAKGVRSILKRSNWKDRTYTDDNGNVTAVDFSYDDLRQLHIKNFKALFFRKYGYPVSDNFQLEVFADGDDLLLDSAQTIHDYIIQDKEWEVSGHAGIFKFILKDMTRDEENDVMYESGDFGRLQAVVGLLVYHDDIGAIVIAGKKEYIELCNPSRR